MNNLFLMTVTALWNINRHSNDWNRTQNTEQIFFSTLFDPKSADHVHVHGYEDYDDFRE